MAMVGNCKAQTTRAVSGIAEAKMVITSQLEVSPQGGVKMCTLEQGDAPGSRAKQLWARVVPNGNWIRSGARASPRSALQDEPAC